MTSSNDLNAKALQLLESLYDGVASPDRWKHSLQQVNYALGGISTALVTMHRPTGTLSLDYAGALLPNVEAGFFEMQDVDPAREAEALLASGHIYVDHDFHGAKNLRRRPFYSEFLNKHDIGHYALLPSGSGGDYIHTLSVQRELGRQMFTAQEKLLMRAVQPHLRNALNLRQQLARQQTEALISNIALNALTFPLLVCCAQGHIVSQNDVASQWLLTRGSPPFHTPAYLPATVRNLLARACGHQVEQASAGALALPDSNVLVVLPFAPTFGAHVSDALALVAVQGPQWRVPAPGSLLRMLFGLTPAEIRLVHHLIQNDEPMPAVAEHLQLSLNTLRTQLRAVFQKTHTRRQSDLLRLMDQIGLVTPPGNRSNENAD